MAQLATPLAFVVAEQVCAVTPVPKVKVTFLAPSGVAAAGSSVLKTPDSVTDCPLVAVVAPV